VPRVVSQLSILHPHQADHGRRDRLAPGEAWAPASPFAKLVDGAGEAGPSGKEQSSRTSANPTAPATAAVPARADKAVPDPGAPQAPQTATNNQASRSAPPTASFENAQATAKAAAIASLSDDKTGSDHMALGDEKVASDDKAANANTESTTVLSEDAAVAVTPADTNAAQPTPEPPPAAPPVVVALAPPPLLPVAPAAADQDAIEAAPVNDAALVAPNLNTDDVAAPNLRTDDIATPVALNLGTDDIAAPAVPSLEADDGAASADVAALVSQPGRPDAASAASVTGLAGATARGGPTGAGSSAESKVAAGPDESGGSDKLLNAADADTDNLRGAPKTTPKQAPTLRPVLRPHAGGNTAQGSSQAEGGPSVPAPAAPESTSLESTSRENKAAHANAGAVARAEPDAPEQGVSATPHLEPHAADAAPAAKSALDALALVNMPRTTEPLGNAVASAAVMAHAPAAAEATPVPIAGLAVEIAARAHAGRNRFEIRLDPPELGRIDVRLDIDSSGQVTSRLVVERAETLEVLRRDAGELQRAFQDAGLKTSDNGLQFALRDQNFAGRNDHAASPWHARVIVPDGSVGAIDTLPDHGRVYRSGGIDIRV